MKTVRKVLSNLCELIDENLQAVTDGRKSVTWKSDGSPVTTSDIFLETLISKYLQDKIPGIIVIGEETFLGEPTVISGLRAVVDPIDGTENFCSGLPIWGTAVSIWDGNSHVASLIYMPELKIRMMTGDSQIQHRSRIAGFSSSLSDELLHKMSKTREARIFGCAVYNMLNVIRGSFTSFENPVGAYSWDLLAGLALAREAGCKILVDGEKYDGFYLEPGKKYRVRIENA